MPVGFIGSPLPDAGVIGPGTIAQCAVGGGTINVNDYVVFSVQTTGGSPVELMQATVTWRAATSTTVGLQVPLGINQDYPGHNMTSIQAAWNTLAPGISCFIRYSLIQGFSTVASIDGPTLTWEPRLFGYPILSRLLDRLSSGGSSVHSIDEVYAAVVRVFPPS